MTIFANRLAQETSPYLLQHKTNPVDWHSWGDDAFARARAENKPILLSVGYAACHWCHVMAHESFEDPKVAAVMNRLFVNIKVDREERPDLDAIYQHALALLGEHGGWPLTMFLTPAGEPFWGGTYFPPEPRYGRPAFPQVLEALARAWHEAPDKIQENVRGLKDGLERLGRSQPGAAIGADAIAAAARAALGGVDPVAGGLRGAPKFPQVSLFELLWRQALRSGESAMANAVVLTLDMICRGGIYDHLGGGFARYSTDSRWLAPHFEKMLYDNASLIELMTLVWQRTRSPLYARRIEQTVAWLLREMLAEGGAFAAALDADSEGEEGRFYVWSEAEIDSALGADSARFKRAYDVSAAGNWEATNILNRLASDDVDEEDNTVLAQARARLLQIRDRRPRPAWDDKLLADWNGLTIAALAAAAAAFERQPWLDAAVTAFSAVVARMDRDGRLGHAYRKAKLVFPGMLDDHAAMARAALTLFELTGEDAYLALAKGWVEQLDRHYWDNVDGGYFFSADDAESLIVRTKSAYDQATPSGNGQMVEVLTKLHLITGEDRYRTRAETVVGAFAGVIQANPLAATALVNGADSLIAARQIVIVGARAGDDTKALLGAVHDSSLPGRVLLVVEPGQDLPRAHPAHGKTQVQGRATAYLCQGQTCSLPIPDRDALASALAQS